MAKIIKLPSAFVIETKVVGVSKMNADGSSRQEIIKKEVEEGDKMLLSPEPDNDYDPNAIQVLSKRRGMIGYLSKEVAGRLQNALNADIEINVTATWVSGDKYTGVGLRIELVN